MNAFLGQVRIASRRPVGGGCAHSSMDGPYLGEGLRCWKAEDGGTVCSDFMYHPPGCPTAPAVTESKVLPTPPEAARGVCSGSGMAISRSYPIPSESPAAMPSPEAPSEFPVVPVAIGSAALIGLFLALR